MTDNQVPRRDFIKTAGAAAATALSYTRVLGANERVQLGLIGCGDARRGDMGKFVRSRVPWMSRRSAMSTRADRRRRKAAPKAKAFSDHRKLLEMKEVDAVLIAVPDHWHAAIAHRRAERRQGRLRREAADAARSRKVRRS